MKVTLGVILFSAVQLFASDGYSQDIRFTLTKANSTIEDVLNVIEDQSDYYFLYNGKLVDVTQRVNIRIENQDIGKTLDELLRNTDITYKIYNRQVVLSPAEGQISTQQVREVSGKVTDPSGAPLPGVTVVIKGTSTGTIAGADGDYMLSDVSANAVLVFSFVGMKTQEIAVGSKASIHIKMEEETVGIEEVVAVGYGTQKKVNLTGSVAAVNFDDQLQNRPITNASQALSGKVSGLWVSQVSGKPGNDGTLLRVRGWGTLNEAAPMILIDGVEGSMDRVNPNDIESISVLKDAASAAIYGSRAANGVILIQTKSGNYNEKTRVSLSSYAGAQSLGRRYDLVDNSVEYMQLWNQALHNIGSSPIFPESVINDFKNNNDPYLYPNVNFFDEVYRNALITESQLSLSGGSSSLRYYMSMNRLDQDGIMKATNSKRYGFNLNLQSKVNDWLEVGARMSTISRDSREPFNLGTLGLGEVFANGAYPFTAPYTKDGRLGGVQALNSSGNQIVGNRNPMIELEEGFTKTESNSSKVNVFADVRLAKGLVFKTNFSTQNSTTVTDKANELLVGYTSTGVTAANLYYGQVALQMSRSNSVSKSISWFNTLNFDKRFFDVHQVSGVLGMQVEDFETKTVAATRTNPPKVGLTQVDAGTTGITNSGNLVRLRMLSYFGRVNYSLKDRYLLEVNLRADASSRFKKGNRWTLFPGVSAGWIISEENFLQNQNLFSRLKLRGSYGKLGNQNGISYWPYLTVVTQNNAASYNLGGSFVPGAAVTALTDESITWETTTTYDAGLEMGFFDNSLLVEGVYFRKYTNDIIVQLPIPQILGGLTAPYENVGEMLNNGFEINLSYHNSRNAGRQKLQYGIDLNFGYVNNEVTKFQGGKSPDQLYLIREDYPYRTLYTWKATGIYQTDQEAAEHLYDNGFKPHAGDLKYEDVNNDGIMDYRDYQEIGSTIPKFTFGGTVKLNYKNFDFSVLFQGIANVHDYTNNAWTNPLGVSGGTITKRWKDAWSETNKDTDIPILKINDPWNWKPSSFWIKDISFLKVRNIQLGYKYVDKRLWFDNIYVYVNAENVLTLVDKDYEGYDPERGNYFDSGVYSYPLPKTVTLGVNINF